MRLTVIAALVLAFLCQEHPAQAGDSDAPVIKGALGRKLDKRIVRAGGADFWGSVLVARKGRILLARGYGFADYARTPNTPRTLYELASASKQVAAVAILHLEQRKKLAVTDTLNRFFKKVPRDKKAIQIHHLLTHTSGISGKVGVPYASRITRKEYVKTMLAEPLIAKPGEEFHYCNVGYALLAAIVEVVSRTSFENYVEKWLFKPAKMEDTGFIRDLDLIRSGRASARRTRGSTMWSAANWHWGWGYRGMGGVVTTVLDLLRWDRALRSDVVLGEKARKAMYTPFKNGYAYGWRVEPTERGTTRVHHAGGVAGYGTNIVRYLEENVAIFVLTNNGQAAYDVTAALENMLFPLVPLEAVIDTRPYKLGRSRILNLSGKLAWKGVKKRNGFTLRLRDGEHTPLEVHMPGTYAAKLAASLEQAIARRIADDDGKPSKIEAGLYLQPYARSPRRISLDERLKMVIQPEYRSKDEMGNPVVDRRVLFILQDFKHGQWPVMAKMNVAAARLLLGMLRATSGPAR